jgi:hypothetical protein
LKLEVAVGNQLYLFGPWLDRGQFKFGLSPRRNTQAEKARQQNDQMSSHIFGFGAAKFYARLSIRSAFEMCATAARASQLLRIPK